MFLNDGRKGNNIVKVAETSEPFETSEYSECIILSTVVGHYIIQKA